MGGVTLVELMVAILIMAILGMIAVPSFRDASLASRLNAISSSLYADVQVARSEAIKSNGSTTLCASSNGSSCAGSGDWEQGWIVIDADSHVIQSQAALPAGFKVIQTGGTASLTFQPIGIVSSSATFTVCRQTPVGRQERVVRLLGTGVAYVDRTANGTCP
jgi:type IV fimbrial biogenesis protein FimT